ncbi:hypothetical protein [Agrobacterium larrymoorei]|nr:hypothetical protein [Agrobacterium larrymoorei]
MSALLSHSGKLLLGAVATAAFLYATIATFDGWLRHGTDIFLSAVQSGIAWCL